MILMLPPLLPPPPLLNHPCKKIKQTKKSNIQWHKKHITTQSIWCTATWWLTIIIILEKAKYSDEHIFRFPIYYSAPIITANLLWLDDIHPILNSHTEELYLQLYTKHIRNYVNILCWKYREKLAMSNTRSNIQLELYYHRCNFIVLYM